MKHPIDADAFLNNQVDDEQLHALTQADDVIVEDFVRDMGMHLYLSVRLRKDSEFDQRLLGHIQQSMGRSPAVADAEFTISPERSQSAWRRWWALWLGGLLLMLGLVLALGLSTTWWPSLNQQPTSSQPTEAPLPQRLVSGLMQADEEEQTFQIEHNLRATLQPQTLLNIPDDQALPWELQQGSLAVTTHLPWSTPLAVRGNSAVVSGGGHWLLSRGGHRDRLTVVAGEPGITNQRGVQQATLPGQIWDIAPGGIPRLLTVSQAARLPDHFARQSARAQVVVAADDAATFGGDTSSYHLPFMAPPAYDLHIDLRRQSGSSSLAIQIPRAGQSPVVFFFDGWEGTRHGFSLHGGDYDVPNSTAVWTGPLLRQHALAQIDVLVRPDAIAVYIDNTLLSWLNEDTAVSAAADLIWPAVTAPSAVVLHPHTDRFEIAGLSCTIHQDGVGANADMYGPQLDAGGH